MAGPIVALSYVSAAGWTEAELKEKCYQIRTNETTMVRVCESFALFMLQRLFVGFGLLILSIFQKNFAELFMDFFMPKMRTSELRVKSFDELQDRASLTFGLVGWYWKRFQGAVDGVNIALAYSVVYSQVRWHSPSFFVESQVFT